MILTVDIGNTNIVLGGYTAGALSFCTRIATDAGLETDQYALQINGILTLYALRTSEIEGAIISSAVPPLTETIAHAIERICDKKPILFGQNLPTGVTVDIDRPAELGADLLAGAVGAKANYPLPAIVIDMGTATKITAINAHGAVIGVSIMPGVFLSLRALVQSASQLGGIAMQAPACAIGRNTVASMQSGVVFGAASMLDGMLDRFCAEMGAVTTIVATGGAASAVIPHCKRTMIHNPTLILDGLYTVYTSMQTQA